jgi:membrane protein DedA with SNARE-associated domain
MARLAYFSRDWQYFRHIGRLQEGQTPLASPKGSYRTPNNLHLPQWRIKIAGGLHPAFRVFRATNNCGEMPPDPLSQIAAAAPAHLPACCDGVYERPAFGVTGLLDHILALLAGFVVATISSLGLLGIVLMMAIESACIPLPSEIIMPFAGYLVSLGEFNLYMAATAGAIGCNLGSAVAYAVGQYGGRPFVERWGGYVLITTRELDWAERFFARYGSPAVFIGRLLPVVRTFIALPAGVARMPLVKFHVYTFVGSWLWCLALAYVGVKLGQAWESDPTLRSIMHRLDAVIAAVLVVAVAVYIWRHWRNRVRGAD